MKRMRQLVGAPMATLIAQACRRPARRWTIRRDSFRIATASRFRWKMHVFCGSGDDRIHARRARQGARMTTELDLQCINTLRFLSVDMVQKANSGHPGLPLGAAPMAYVLWTRWLKHNPAQSALGRSRPLRAVGRARFGAALQPAAPDGLRPLAGRHQAIPPVGQQDARASRARTHAGRGSHHRAAGPGHGQCGRHGDRRSAAGRALQPPRSRRDRPPYLRHRQRRRPDGRRCQRGGVARRAPARSAS